jgi:Lrp/AsnC family transcriptional regulator, regulator for asnA, asnC and gidA
MVDSSSSSSLGATQTHEIDQLDLQIMAYLQVDGRLPYSYIAREVSVPEATIRYRVKRLLDEQIIKIGAFINAGKLKYENVAYLELDVEPSFFNASLQALINMEKISYIASVTGDFNVMMEYVYRDNEDLLKFINSIKGKSEVNRLRTRTILKIHKAQYPIQVKS